MSSGKQKLISQVTAAEAPAIVCWHNAEGQGTQEDQMLDQSQIYSSKRKKPGF
jgi:hypothetical protein